MDSNEKSTRKKIVRLFRYGVLSLMGILLLLGICLLTFLYSRMETVSEEPMQISSVIHDQKYLVSITEAEKWLQEKYYSTNLPSISLAVGVKGELVWAGAIGYSDIENKILATVNSKYEIGSISKILTASALVSLDEKGVLCIDSSFHYYVKDFPRKCWPFSLKQLASHQAGVRGYRKGVSKLSEIFNQTEYASTKEAASIVASDTLLFEPGSRVQYSTYGYTLIALAMEQASGLNYPDLMRRELLKPLNMGSTQLDVRGSQITNLAKPYILYNKRIFRAIDSNKSYRYAGGGYLSTPTDMVKLGNALIFNKFITEKTREKLWTPEQNTFMKKSAHDNYALGFKVVESELGSNVCHGGSTNGSFAYYLINPQHEIVIAFTSNARPISNVMNRFGEMIKITRIFTEISGTES